MTNVRVNLVSGGYDVLIGPVEAAFDQIADLARGAAQRIGMHSSQYVCVA